MTHQITTDSLAPIIEEKDGQLGTMGFVHKFLYTLTFTHNNIKQIVQYFLAMCIDNQSSKENLKQFLMNTITDLSFIQDNLLQDIYLMI